jgi:hypothetical protein
VTVRKTAFLVNVELYQKLFDRVKLAIPNEQTVRVRSRIPTLDQEKPLTTHNRDSNAKSNKTDLSPFCTCPYCLKGIHAHELVAHIRALHPAEKNQALNASLTSLIAQYSVFIEKQAGNTKSQMKPDEPGDAVEPPVQNMTDHGKKLHVACPHCHMTVVPEFLAWHIAHLHSGKMEASSSPPNLPALSVPDPHESRQLEVPSINNLKIESHKDELRSVRCHLCEDAVSAEGLERHIAELHGLLIQSPAGHPMVQCPRCNSKVRVDRLQTHLDKVHSGRILSITSNESLAEQETCRKRRDLVRLERIERERIAKMESEFPKMECPHCKKKVIGVELQKHIGQSHPTLVADVVKNPALDKKHNLSTKLPPAPELESLRRIPFLNLTDSQLVEILEAKAREAMTIEEAVVDLADRHFGRYVPKMNFCVTFEEAVDRTRKSKIRQVIKRLQSMERRLGGVINNLLTSATVANAYVGTLDRRIGIALQALISPLGMDGRHFISMADLHENFAFETMTHMEQLQVLRVRDKYLKMTHSAGCEPPLTYSEWLIRSQCGTIPVATQMWIHEVNFDARIAISRLLGTSTFGQTNNRRNSRHPSQAPVPNWSLAGLRERTCAACGRGTLSTTDMCSDCRPTSSSRKGEAGRPCRGVTESNSPIDRFEDRNSRSSAYHGETIRDDI